MNRENISLQHYNFNDDEGKIEWLLPFYLILGLQLYMFLLKRCLELAQMIYDSGYLTGIYHGDLSYQERQTVQQQFLIMTSLVIVATSAFGMGINKKIFVQSYIFIYHLHHLTIYKKLVVLVGMVKKSKLIVLFRLSLTEVPKQCCIQDLRLEPIQILNRKAA